MRLRRGLDRFQLAGSQRIERTARFVKERRNFCQETPCRTRIGNNLADLFDTIHQLTGTQDLLGWDDRASLCRPPPDQAIFHNPIVDSSSRNYEAGRCFEELSNPVDARRQFELVVQRHDETPWARMARDRLEKLSETGLPGLGRSRDGAPAAQGG